MPRKSTKIKAYIFAIKDRMYTKEDGSQVPTYINVMLAHYDIKSATDLMTRYCKVRERSTEGMIIHVKQLTKKQQLIYDDDYVRREEEMVRDLENGGK